MVTGDPEIRARGRRARVVATGEHAWRWFRSTTGGELFEEFVELRAIDRALALASKLFIAILPMSILITALVSGQAFGNELVARFNLTGTGASAARALFASPSQVQSGIGLLGLVVLTSSILSFVRALERLYLDCWRLRAGARSARGRVVWLAGFVAWAAATALVHDWTAETDAEVAGWLAAGVVGGAFFLWTATVLLGDRVSRRRLLPTALATGIAIAVFAAGSDLVMPGLVTRNTLRYGLIGFTFSLVSWLFSAALLVVTAAMLGAIVDRRRSRGRPATAGPA